MPPAPRKCTSRPCCPASPYEATGRWEDYGDNLFRLIDRRGADYLLAPTHEEMFTLLVKDLAVSYKDLPLSLFQIQTKYRDEARPRGGLLRLREFVMKDSYSFDLDDAGLRRSYEHHRLAYRRIFTRLGLPYLVVSAISGAMGGSMSEEFLLPARRRRGHLRALHGLRLRGQHRGGRDAGAGSAADHGPARRPRRGHAGHADHRRARRFPQRPTWPGPTGPGQPSDLLKNVIVRLRQPDGRSRDVGDRRARRS